MKKNWKPDSWRGLPIQQQPKYADESALNHVLSTLSKYPPLVFAGEIESLKDQLAVAATGGAFLLQGGDCAEKFADCNELSITRKLKILLQMSVILCYGARRPIVRIGRIAGQYGKPRSNPTEIVDGVELNVYRGDNINAFTPDPKLRMPDPERLLKGYHLSSMTLNYVRALTKGGFADLHYPDNWNLDFLENSPQKGKYEDIVTNIQNAIAFMESLGGREKSLGTVDFYTSHEGLLLGFEESMTRFVPEYGKYFNLGAHMLWIGDRTRQLDGAHVEYFRGIANPIGIKVGPTSDIKDIIAVIKAINPENEAGRVTLITRYGHELISKHLKPMIEAVTESKLNVLWSSDPMHGNAIKTKENVKTRDFSSILSELRQSFEIHKSSNSYLGGVHFELTGDNVTECVGGSEGISTSDLDRNYETYCDPRLNYTQSLEMAFLISSMLKETQQN